MERAESSFFLYLADRLRPMLVRFQALSNECNHVVMRKAPKIAATVALPTYELG
jgi:hypothetical protein